MPRIPEKMRSITNNENATEEELSMVKRWRAYKKAKLKRYYEKRPDARTRLCRAANVKRKTVASYRVSMIKSRAKQRGIQWVLPNEMAATLVVKPCHYCGSSERMNGLDRINSHDGYEQGNIVTCCATCNLMKGVLSYEAFIHRCKLVWETAGKN